MIRKIELLAPAANLDSGRIAIDSGADAVYIGGPAFGARAAAGNSIEDIASLVRYAHFFGAKVYAALNTVLYETELACAEKTARSLMNAGVDALIIQDMAFLRMGLTGIEFHASTQMCNTTTAQVEFLRETGFSRVILERGLTLDEIRAVGQVEDIELECFVHGAICVGFSGQCYLSRSMSDRSGNRGDCSQPCRLTYDLLDGSGETVIREKHLLSVRDLNLTERIPQLLDAGVSSFKIEGRLKDSNYVRNVVGHYRRVIDRALETRPMFTRSSYGHSELDFEPDPSRSFSRGFTTWMLDGKMAGQASFSTPKATGEYIGKVKSVGRESFELPDSRLNPGDGICFVHNGELKGTNVNRVEGSAVFPNRTDGIGRGNEIFRNHDHRFEAQLCKSRTHRVIDIDILISVSRDSIVVTFADAYGHRTTTCAELTGEPARDPAKMEANIKEQLSKLGDTVFNAKNVTVETDGEIPFIPISRLNELRRSASVALAEAVAADTPEPTTHIENDSFPCPSGELGGEANITNSLAERFYRDHGVTTFPEPLETMRTLSGQRVMNSAYCLRRELNQCLKKNPNLRGPLRLKRGAITWLLDFDCAACRMNIIKD